MDITIAQEGWRFVLTCLERYQGEGSFFIWFLFAMIYLWWSDRNVDDVADGISQRVMIRWSIPYVIVLALTVFNVVLMRLVVSKLRMEDEYYRFIWILPVTVITAFAATRIVIRRHSWWIRVGLIGVLAIIMLFTGKTILGRGFSLAENVYKIPNDVIEISKIIHQDSESENPKIIAEFDLIVLLNQYDPSLCIEIAYGDVSTLRDVDEEQYYELDRWLTSRVAIMDVVLDGNISRPDWDFIAAMDYADVQYLVVTKNPDAEKYFENARCVPIGMTEQYIVYRYYNTLLSIPGE